MFGTIITSLDGNEGESDDVFNCDKTQQIKVISKHEMIDEPIPEVMPALEGALGHNRRSAIQRALVERVEQHTCPPMQSNVAQSQIVSRKNRIKTKS